MAPIRISQTRGKSARPHRLIDRVHLLVASCVGANLLYLAMASQVTGTSLRALEFDSYIRGYHEYQAIWNPTLSEVLRLERETDNEKDKFAVAVIKERKTVVGHIPYSIAPVVSHFLRRGTNKATVEVTGAAMNRGAGYGMEIPCKYRFYGSSEYIERLQELLSS